MLDKFCPHVYNYTVTKASVSFRLSDAFPIVIRIATGMHTRGGKGENMVKYVFVTGGVVSGLGKGITAASLGRLLKSRGYNVTMQKFDPYINMDPGTMNPIQHGEVFVTDDGTETDLDLGHYERFINESLGHNSNVTTGKVYWSVLNKERHGDYNGGTVQVIPHITNEIKSRFHKPQSEDENIISIIEIGGTTGDIESQPFLEAIRQFQSEVGRENAVIIHVTLIPYIKASGELKTKPTQMSVKTLQSMGLWPDIIVCRSDYPVDDDLKAKIALFCNVKKEHVLQNLDASSLYEVPLMLEKENLAGAVCECLNIPCPEPDLTRWKEMVDSLKAPEHEVNIALVGKYVNLEYPLPGGAKVKFLNDKTTYLGTQIESQIVDGLCFGVLANMDFILICTYGEGGADPELILYKKR